MRVAVAPIVLFASLASALPQWSDHYKREVPTPSPNLVQRQESIAFPGDKREAPTPSPNLIQRQESFVPPPFSPETPTPEAAVRRQESFVPPPLSPRTPIPEAAVRRQESFVPPPKRDVPPTPVPQAAGKDRIVQRQKTDWYVLPPRDIPLPTPAPDGPAAAAIVERQDTEFGPIGGRGMPLVTPAPYGEPAAAIAKRQKTEEDPITDPPKARDVAMTNARRADGPEPTNTSDQPAEAIVPRQRTEDNPPARRADGSAPEPTEPPSPCDAAGPAKVQPRTEEGEPTDPPKAEARAATDTNPILKALSGTYALVNTSSSRNGEPIPDLPYGKAPVGLLIYTESGFMSATITATEPEFRPNLTFPYQPNDSDADWALVGKHSIGYAGPYSVNNELPATETEGQIFHGPLTVANVPSWEGQRGKRNYTIVDVEEKGEKVRYLRIGSERGNGYRGILWWKRVD
jgi:hypothetical protein